MTLIAHGRIEKYDGHLTVTFVTIDGVKKLR